MSRYTYPQAQPPQPTVEGDAQFVGLQMKLDRDKLQPGYLARAENNRLKKGVAAPRGGIITPKFANIIQDSPAGFTVVGSGLYSNPNGEEVILLAGTDEVLIVKSGSYPASVGLPAGVNLGGLPFDKPLVFAQHFDKILLHRPDGAETLEWDGIAPAFRAISKSDPTDTSTVLMPNPPWSINFADRAIFPIPGEPDQLGVSDIDDYTSYDSILMKFRINRGTADSIVGAYPFPTNNVIVGKNHGIDVLTNFVGDLANASMEIITTEVGMCARLATKMVGADMFFLSSDHEAVFKISEVIQNRLQQEPVPISDAIEPIMKRINWKAAGLSVAAVHDIYYFLAVPLDGAEDPNAMLVFNTVTQQWESAPDSWPQADMHFQNLIHSYYFGDAALYSVNHFTSSVHIHEIDTNDEWLNQRFEIQHLIETRAYATLGWNSSTRRDFKHMKMTVATLRPQITLTQLMDGTNDERVLTSKPITRNPLKYRNFSKSDFNPSNDNEDFANPGREDYSQDFTNDFNLEQNGVELEMKQRDVLPLSTIARGRYVSYRMENAQGKCEVGGVLADSTGTQRNEPRRAG